MKLLPRADDKFVIVRELLAGRTPETTSLLDAGCRGCELRPHVEDRARYVGVDLMQNAAGSVDHVGDIARGLPFPDRSFDYVVALDVLEHMDDFHAGMTELARVTRERLVVVLPNYAHLNVRWRFLRHGGLGNKYELPLGTVADRHRWVTVLPQTDRYMDWFAEREGFTVRRSQVNDGRAAALFGKVGHALGIPRRLWVWKSLHLLERVRPA